MLETTFHPIHSFADDSTLHARLPAGPLSFARQQVTDSLDSDLAKIEEWGKQWLVTFNASKTFQLIISRRIEQDHPAVHFQGIPLSFSSSMKLLGISFDGKLSIDSHIHSKL